MNKPIINPSTLSEEQREAIRGHYHTNECVIRDHKKRTGDKAQTRAVARIRLFEHLFGKGFFKKGE